MGEMRQKEKAVPGFCHEDGCACKRKPCMWWYHLTPLSRSPAKGVLGPHLSRWASPQHINTWLTCYRDGSLPWSAGGHPVSPHNVGVLPQGCAQRGAGRTWPHGHCHAEPWARPLCPESRSSQTQPFLGQLMTALSSVHRDSRAVQNLLLNGVWRLFC